MGVPPSGSGREASPSAVPASRSRVPNAEELARLHEFYGPCDGFGPLWTCSACTGLIGGGERIVSVFGKDQVIDPEEAANIIGDFLIEKAEASALEAMGCCDSPAAVSDYMRRALIIDFPGNPWRHQKLARRETPDA